MSVNTSAIDFRQRHFVESVEQVLADTGLDPCLLELEITESVLMQNVDATMSALQRLKSLGIKLAIDDFGTGYSSLSYLRRFPIDVLKIDQSFIRGLSSDSSDAALVGAIISLGKSLSLNVIAEGVETAAQLKYLKDHHCEEAQGFYFSEALPAPAFAQLLTQDCRGPGPIHRPPATVRRPARGTISNEPFPIHAALCLRGLCQCCQRAIEPATQAVARDGSR